MNGIAVTAIPTKLDILKIEKKKFFRTLTDQKLAIITANLT